jgi:hypothetical protein
MARAVPRAAPPGRAVTGWRGRRRLALAARARVACSAASASVRAEWGSRSRPEPPPDRSVSPGRRRRAAARARGCRCSSGSLLWTTRNASRPMRSVTPESEATGRASLACRLTPGPGVAKIAGPRQRALWTARDRIAFRDLRMTRRASVFRLSTTCPTNSESASARAAAAAGSRARAASRSKTDGDTGPLQPGAQLFGEHQETEDRRRRGSAAAELSLSFGAQKLRTSTVTVTARRLKAAVPADEASSSQESSSSSSFEMGYARAGWLRVLPGQSSFTMSELPMSRVGLGGVILSI